MNGTAAAVADDALTKEKPISLPKKLKEKLAGLSGDVIEKQMTYNENIYASETD